MSNVKGQGQWSAGDEILFLLYPPLYFLSPNHTHTFNFFFNPPEVTMLDQRAID